ncbi:MAG: peptidoglycan DD-metalloendopeptidase family protein, partial [bacterium]|nr:peptidoglycan DD-metalloendopeptidase family protein [bacterium]
LKITYLSTQPVRSAAATFSQKTFKAFKKGSSINQFYQFIGMPRSLKPGKYQIKTKVSLKNGRHYINKLNIIIKKGDFVCSKITLKGKANRLNKKTKQLSNEAKILSKKFRKIYKKAFFKRNFIRPAKGKTTTPFGAYRSYNGTFTRKHSGIDIANKKGTSVVAANNGKVTISADFICNGKTIVIDHGLGIQTVYSHLSKRIVKAGKWVKRGELIGLMGSSGISTGSHVHWGLSINNTRVDPQFWLDNPSLYK